MQNESQNIEYKESWGRGFKKIAEEFERACLPLPTIEENGGGVMAIVQRKTIDEVIAERGGDVGVNVGVNSIEISDVKLTERQTIMVSVIKSNPWSHETILGIQAVTLQEIGTRIGADNSFLKTLIIKIQQSLSPEFDTFLKQHGIFK